MKNIPHPDLKDAIRLSAADMNRIHFGGTHSVLDTTADIPR